MGMIVESLMSGKLAADNFLQAVEAEIEGAEARNRRVPPGPLHPYRLHAASA
jgi:hypothetical protein